MKLLKWFDAHFSDHAYHVWDTHRPILLVSGSFEVEFIKTQKRKRKKPTLEIIKNKYRELVSPNISSSIE